MSTPRLTTVNPQPPTQDVAKLIDAHREALIILVNPDAEGEFNLAVFSKIANRGGVLSSYLSTLLENLKRTSRHGPKTRHRRNAAPTRP
jgi:hypothetical protein